MAFHVASIIIPVAHYHRDVVDRAYASARQQTIPCDVLVIHDSDQRGAAWARNQGIAQAITPFVSFLDADDEMLPTYVEKTLRRWIETGAGPTYIFTDWRLPDGRARYAENDFDFFHLGMAHIVTTLVATAAVRAIGGFDETIRGAGEEDEDFYARLHVAGMCHARVPEPLVLYHKDQGASRVNPGRADFAANVAAAEKRFHEKFGKYRGITMGCCGNDVAPQGPAPLNEPFENSILVRAMYNPMRLTGPVSGIGYQRAGLGQLMHVDKRDQQARPDMWQIVPKVENLVPPKEDVLRSAGLI